MSYSMSMNMQHKQTQSLKQAQRLIMSPQMQQAIQLLQMPIMEISAAIDEEMQTNPVLEYSEPLRESTQETPSEEHTEVAEMNFSRDDFEVLKHLSEEFDGHFAESGNYYTRRTQEEDKLKTFQETNIVQEQSLFRHLMEQAEHSFTHPDDLRMAECIIGNLDESGFLGCSLEEIGVLNNFELLDLSEILEEIQRFEPRGVGARDLRESLLIQLRVQHKQDSLAYDIVDKYYDDLLHNRIPAIKAGLKVSAEDIRVAVEEDICPLDLSPGGSRTQAPVHYVTPDVTVDLDGDVLTASINDERIPSLRLNHRYLRMLEGNELTSEAKEYVKQKVMSGKWLLKSLHQRHDTVLRITDYLIEQQREFFTQPDGQLKPLTMKRVAEALDIHESTVARAVANKHVSCDRGIVPLRSFFTNAYKTQEGDNISANTVKGQVRDIIETEDKAKPLSDEAISRMIRDSGVQCARRTVAKYRKELNLGNAAQRRVYS